MLEVLIGCSACEDELEVIVVSLEEAEQLACDCGAGYVIEAIAEIELSAFASPRPRLRALEGETGDAGSAADPLRRAA